jgi:hypothetical protein
VKLKLQFGVINLGVMGHGLCMHDLLWIDELSYFLASTIQQNVIVVVDDICCHAARRSTVHYCF